MCEKCEAANEGGFQLCFACGHASRLGRLAGISVGRHRTTLHSHSMINLPVAAPGEHEEGGSSEANSRKAVRQASTADFRFRTSNLLRNSSPQGMGNRMALLSKISNLFVEASSVHGIDQPLCRDCFRKTDKLLQARILDLKSQCALYRASVMEVGALGAALEGDEDDEFHGLGDSESSLDEELVALEAQVAGMETELALLKVQAQDWSCRATYSTNLLNESRQRCQDVEQELLVKEGSVAEVEQALHHQRNELQRLSRSMPLSDVFYIWFDGLLGTISSHRLGRMSSMPVDWTEINAAWGFATLLLRALATSIGVVFKDWEPVPMGVMSKMRNISENALYELYFSSDLSLGRFFWYRKYDNAICGFLQCVGEIVTQVSMEDPSYVFPYAISKEKIGPHAAMISVRYQFSEEHEWTRAMKYLLTTLKFATAWLAKKRLDLTGPSASAMREAAKME